MNLPVKHEISAERLLGTASLETIRSRLIQEIENSPKYAWHQKNKIIKELDQLIENERYRREQLAARQLQKEELDHKLIIIQRHCKIYDECAELVRRLQLQKAQTNHTIARYKRERTLWHVEIIERLLQLKAKYKPAEKQDEHLKELRKIRQQQKLSEAKEQVILDSLAKKAMNRATFIKMVNKQFPDMADELLDFYDQQLFQHGTRR